MQPLGGQKGLNTSLAETEKLNTNHKRPDNYPAESEFLIAAKKGQATVLGCVLWMGVSGLIWIPGVECGCCPRDHGHDDHRHHAQPQTRTATSSHKQPRTATDSHRQPSLWCSTFVAPNENSLSIGKASVGVYTPAKNTSHDRS